MRRARGEAFTDAASPGLSAGSGRRTTVGRKARPGSAFAGAAARGAAGGAFATGGAFSAAAGAFPRRGEDGDHGADRRRLALPYPHLGERALVVGLELHVGLVGLDLGDDLADRHALARMLEPLQDLALLHRVGELRHGDVDRHARARPTAPAARAPEVRVRPPSPPPRAAGGRSRSRARATAAPAPPGCARRASARPGS